MGTDDAAGGGLASKTDHSSSLAECSLCRHTPEVGAVCGKAARTVLCGGREMKLASLPQQTLSAAVHEFSKCAGFRTPACRDYRRALTAGVRKPAQNRKSVGSRCTHGPPDRNMPFRLRCNEVVEAERHMRFNRLRRREFITLLGSAAAAWPLDVRAQQSKVRRIGALVLGNADAESFRTELRDGLRELGYVGEQNINFDFRSAGGNIDLLPQLAAELVALRATIGECQHRSRFRLNERDDRARRSPQSSSTKRFTAGDKRPSSFDGYLGPCFSWH